MVYPAKTPADDWRPRDNTCFAACLATALAANATLAAGLDLVVDLVVEGIVAARTLSIGSIIVGASSAYFGYDSCKAECGQ